MAKGDLVLLIKSDGGIPSLKSALSQTKRRIHVLWELGFDIQLVVGPASLQAQNLPTPPPTDGSATSNDASNTSAVQPSPPSPAASTQPESNSPENVLAQRMAQATVEAEAAAADAQEMEEIGQPEMYGHPGTVERELPEATAPERLGRTMAANQAGAQDPAETKRSKGGRRSYS